MIAAVPLTIIPLILYNLLGFVYGGAPWGNEILSFPMVSEVRWSLTLGDLMIVVAIVFLFFEVLKAARPAPTTLTNHAVSTLVFVVYLVEFILAGVAAHSVFFILTVIALFDVVAGFSISIRTATRDIAFGHTIDGPT